jgi:hypothetical protein
MSQNLTTLYSSSIFSQGVMGALFGDRQLHPAAALQLVLGLYWAAATGAIALLTIALRGGGGRWLRLRQVGYSARCSAVLALAGRG